MKNKKIPEMCYFQLVELKKKWRQRTCKLEIYHEFEEVISNQFITMIYDFTNMKKMITEAENEYYAAKHKNQQKLIDTNDEWSLSSQEIVAKNKLENLTARFRTMQETHKDYTFTGKVMQHKVKFKDERYCTEIIYNIDKPTIDWFDEFKSDLPSYYMLIKDEADDNDDVADIIKKVEDSPFDESLWKTLAE